MRAHFTRTWMNEADKSLTNRLIQALGSGYTLEGEIGRGGMGVVFNARDERLKRQVAVKVLPPELAFREEIRLRFVREAETAARLSHPHIVPIHSVGESPDGLVYVVMAFVDGDSLGANAKRRGPGGDRHAALHEPGAGRGRPRDRRAVGHLQPRCGGLPDARGRAAVPSPHRPRDPDEAYHGASAADHRSAAGGARGSCGLRDA